MKNPSYLKPKGFYCMTEQDLCTDKCSNQCAVCIYYDGGDYREDNLTLDNDDE